MKLSPEELKNTYSLREDVWKTCHSKLATRPILYTDTVKGRQVCRDDMWAVTTDELNAKEIEIAKLRKLLNGRRDCV